jgi:hypothetical protein
MDRFVATAVVLLVTLLISCKPSLRCHHRALRGFLDYGRGLTLEAKRLWCSDANLGNAKAWHSVIPYFNGVRGLKAA